MSGTSFPPPLFGDPDMHHYTWAVSFEVVGGENVPVIMHALPEFYLSGKTRMTRSRRSSHNNSHQVDMLHSLNGGIL